MLLKKLSLVNIYYKKNIKPNLLAIKRRNRETFLKYTLKLNLGIIFHFLFNLWVGKLNTKKLFFKSNDLKIYFIYKSRIIFHYALGIEYRLNELEKSYLLDKIIFNDGDIFIDCGSNIGEVSLYLFRRNPKLKGFLFEIEKPEIEASKKLEGL